MNTCTHPTPTAVQNACKLCAPLGACLAFRGIEKTMPILHGSQGCATYIRRYVIGHFREPMDVASSSFDESSAIFGGTRNLQQGIANITRQYKPAVIGIASTCLSETIGDDPAMIVSEINSDSLAGSGETPPLLITVSTPSYKNTHAEGFRHATLALVKALANGDAPQKIQVNIFPNILSPADLRHLKEIVAGFGIKGMIAPDYSETLDGPALSDYEFLPSGGTPLKALRESGAASHSISFCVSSEEKSSAGHWLEERFGIAHHAQLMPVGIQSTDEFFQKLEMISGRETPRELALERGRLIDAYVDAHKYMFGKRAVIYGDLSLVAGLASFLSELGFMHLLCATGEKCKNFQEMILDQIPEYRGELIVMQDVDFADIGHAVGEIKPDLIFGSSKGYPIARQYNIPLIRVGFPIHDRFGAQRIQHIGYQGTQQLLDRLVNTILERKQDDSPVGYTHL